MTRRQSSDTAPVSETIIEVLGRVSLELNDVAVLFERLEPLMSTGHSKEYLQAPEQLKLLQGIDLAVQKARGLATFLDAVGAQIDVDELVDISTALNLITLEDMKRRLRAGGGQEPSANVYAAASGDAELF